MLKPLIPVNNILWRFPNEKVVFEYIIFEFSKKL